MEENNLVMDSWDDIDLSDLTDDGEVTEEEETEQTEEVQEDEGTEEPEADQPTDTEEQKPDTFTLKVLGEEKSYTREEVVPLAQNGVDYDRVKGQLDEARNTLKEFEKVKSDLAKRNEQVQFMEELAKEQGQTLDELIETTQAQIMSRKTGKALEVCKGIVAHQRRERELQAQQAKLAETGSKNEKRDAEISAFMKAYPELADDPKKVPKEVWDAVNAGETLLSAYRAYEVKELRAQLEKQKAEAEKEKQKQLNKSRSTGSQKTKGTKQADPFDAMWYDGN